METGPSVVVGTAEATPAEATPADESAYRAAVMVTSCSTARAVSCVLFRPNVRSVRYSREAQGGAVGVQTMAPRPSEVDGGLVGKEC